MRKVIEAAIQYMVGAEYELNKFVLNDVNTANFDKYIEILGFTKVVVCGKTSGPVNEGEMVITDRFVFVDKDQQLLYTADMVEEVNGNNVKLKGQATFIKAYAFIKPTGPNADLPKGLRKAIISSLK